MAIESALDVDGGPGLWQNSNYRRLFAGQAISLLGDAVFDTTVVLWVATIIAAGKTWSPLAVGGVLVAAAAPVAIVGPIGGVFADRWNRRRVMLTADAIRALLVGVLIVVAGAGSHLSVGVELTIVYAVVFAGACASQFFNPARFGVIGSVVADADRERAGSLAQGTGALALIIGPPLAAPLLVSAGGASGVRWALLVNALSFVVSFIAISLVRLPSGSAIDAAHDGSAGQSVGKQFRAGLTFLLGNRILVLIAVSAIVCSLGAGSIDALDVFFVTRNLHAHANLYGLLGAAFGAGSLLGAVLSSIFGGKVGASRLFAGGLVATGVLVIAFSRTTKIGEAMAVLFITGIPIVALNAMIGPLIFRSTPKQMVGRVIGLMMPAIQVASLISLFLATWLASTVLRTLDVTVIGIRFRSIDTIFFVGGVLVLLSGVWAALALRGRSMSGDPASPAVIVDQRLEADDVVAEVV